MKKIIYPICALMTVITVIFLLNDINIENEKLKQVQIQSKSILQPQNIFDDTNQTLPLNNQPLPLNNQPPTPNTSPNNTPSDIEYLFYTDKDVSSYVSLSLPEPSPTPPPTASQSFPSQPTSPQLTSTSSPQSITILPNANKPALSSNSTTKPPTDRESRRKAILQDTLTYAESCLGTPYVWGGTRKGSGMDCSGFVQYVYRQVGFELPRTSAEQSKVGRLVKRTELKVGDLLFFDTTNYRDHNDITTPEKECEYAEQVASGYAPNVVSHVGMYVGDNMMIHAASGSGYVRYETIDSDYYKIRFINARRLIKDM